MSNTQKADSGSGCFSGILRRLICQGSHQTHPSDQIAELKEPEFDEPKPGPEIQPCGVPGIVARLMGLDSLPEAKGIQNGKAPETVTRSRSVNFMDYLLQIDLAQANQHRRVRTSVSFREVPTSLQQQNPDLLVRYLDEVDEKKKRNSSTLKKSDGDIRDLKQKKEEKRTNKKENMRVKLDVKKKEITQRNNKKLSKFRDEPRRVSVKHHSKISDYDGTNDLGVILPGKKHARRESGTTLRRRSPLKPIRHQKEVLANPKDANNKNKDRLAAVEEVESVECSSENSSPVSVLDVNDYSIYNDNPSTSTDPRCMDLNSKMKSSLKTMNPHNPSTHSTRTATNNSSVQKKVHESMDDQITDYYKEMVAQLCIITEETIMQSNWMPEKVLDFEDYEEICVQFGQEILDVLLEQVVDELVGFDMEILLCNALDKFQNCV